MQFTTLDCNWLDLIKMKNVNMEHRKNSGQVLVITSLVVVLLLLSTVVYVSETEKNAPVYHPDANTDLSAIKQAAMHTVMSALVNISNGGASSVLGEDLSRFKLAVKDNSYLAISDLKFVALTSASYVNGVSVSWGTNGEGVSSIFVNFALNSSGLSSSYYSDYAVNVTSSISVSGYYTQLSGSLRQVDLTCTVLNEGTPGQMENLVASYEQDSPGGWVQAVLPVSINYGNGTYLTSFTTENTTQSYLPVSVHCIDAREVSVWANVTCAQG
jgi:hypothetical protein